jgi:cyclase
MDYSRRGFVKTSAAASVAALFPRSLVAHAAARAEFAPVRRNVGIFTERGGTMGWLINGDGVLVVDSQFADTAPLFLTGLRERSTRSIDVLINSHHHPDHTGGNAVLRPAARTIVAHSRSAENQRDVAARRGAVDEQALPDATFTDSWNAEIGDETVRAKHYGPAHTGGDVAIFFERANVVHLGDLLNNRGFPNVDAPAGASIHGWIQVLETIAPEFSPDTIYIFGHNEAGFPATGNRDDVYFQRDYFAALIEAAGRALAAGRSREEAAALMELQGFTNFGGTPSRLGLGLGIAYDELVAARGR